MKNFIFLFATVLLTSCATQTSFNDFYQNNQKDSDFSLGLNSSLIRTFLDDDDYEEIKPLLKKAKHVRILVFSEKSDEMNKKFNKFIKNSTFEDIIKVKDDSDNISIFALEEKDRIKEVVVEINTDGELVLLGLRTNLTHDDISNLLDDNEISLNEYLPK